MADPRLLKQIVFNLLHNAIKFTPERGGVEVQTRFDASTESIIVEVADSGPGIAPQLLKSLFDPYALARRRREIGFHDGGEGCGLGLALVKLLTEASGGQVIADSTVGVGSRFAVLLPSAERPESHVEEAGQRVGMPPLVQKPLLGQCFLIVDGDRRSPEAVARLIEAWGGMVDRVGEAADAIRALSERRYDAVMIDDPADGEEGSELARVLRDEDGAEHTTIIIASVDPVPADVAAASGADRCLAKPFTGHMLLESLLKATKATITH